MDVTEFSVYYDLETNKVQNLTYVYVNCYLLPHHRSIVEVYVMHAFSDMSI